MVDDAVGISRTAVQALVDKVKSAFKEEAELWQIVQRDMVFIQDEFEMMESFLSTADGQIVMNSNVVRTWVRQVCDLSHQVEDCAEFLLHLDTKRSWWAFSLRLLPSWCKSGVAQPLDEAVAEIKLLKARVEEVSQRNMRYNLIGDSGPNAAVLMQQQKTAAATSDNIPEASKHQVHSGSGFLDLTKLLTKEDMDLQVISVCGTGGDSGGLSIIRKAYDESRANKDFKCYAWVKLMYPLRSHDFIDDLLAQFYTNSCQQKEQGGETIGVHPLSRMEASACELGKEFKQQVDKHRYLIILEDLSSLAQLDAVRTYLPDMKNGSRIVVSTQQLEIASLCTGKPYRVSELSQFSDDHSVLVFFKEKTSQNSEGFLRNEVKYRKRPSSVRESASDWMNNCFLVGHDQEVDSLYEMITNIRRSVVSVFGTAGVGKSCLVQTVYNRLVANRQYEQFDMFSWVNISHPLDPTDFSNRLLLDMARESTYHLLTKDTIEDCRNCRSLIVIDGLQFKEDWDSIYYNNLELRTYDSCIIVITTDLSIATYCANSSQRVCEIKPLEDDVALDLFRKVFPYEHSKNKEAIREGEVLLPMCGGLPSRIVALASHLGSLAKRPRGIQEGERERLTANFMQELTMAKRDSFQSIFARMRYRFEGCPQLLKRCIFYLRIFPENSNIQRRRLVRRWMAEGYSKGIGSNSMEEDAEKLFDKTAALGMIQQAQWRTGMADDAKKKAPWQVNYLFLEYIISWQKEEKNFFPLEVSVLEGRCSLTTGRVGQHLAICNSWERDEFVFHSLDLSRLRSLTVSGEWSSFFISDKMRVLRVLDLEGTYNLKDSDLEQIGEMLPRLKFLSLRRCKKVSRLPDSLGHLRQLETLDIRDTRVIELPRSIIKLHKLQYLRARTMMDDNDGMAAGAGQQSASSSKTRLHTGISKCFKPGRQGRQLRDHNGVTMPRGIGRLMALRKLGVVDVTTAGDEVILAELHNLKQLNSLHMSGIPRTKDETMFLPPFTGQSLNNNIRFPQNLMKVKLDMPKYWLRREDIQAIGRLEKMHTLRLHVEDIQGGLPYFLRCMQERGDAIAGTSLAHPFGQLKLIEIDCIDMYATFYEDATLEQPKLSLKMMISLRPEELQDLGKLKWIHTLCLYFSTIQLGGLLFAEVQETTYTYIISRSTATADSFGLLKVLEIACRSSLTVKFAERTMKELEKLKFDCFQGSELQLSGLEHLPSLKEVWLKGSFDNKLVEGLQRQLENHQNRPVLKQE